MVNALDGDAAARTLLNGAEEGRALLLGRPVPLDLPQQLVEVAVWSRKPVGRPVTDVSVDPALAASGGLERGRTLLECRRRVGAPREVAESRIGRLGDDEAVVVGVLVGAEIHRLTYGVGFLHPE